MDAKDLITTANTSSSQDLAQRNQGRKMGLSHRIERSSLEVGDHIYSYRTAYSYSHHGIYIGDDTVIHFTQAGVLSSSLDTFLQGGGKLCRYKYSASVVSIIAKRGGTCTTAASDDISMVVHRAKYLLANGFGCYNLFQNNCENFAIYCKTGLLIMENTKGTAGTSGQVASLKSVATAVQVASFYITMGIVTGGPVLAAAAASAQGAICYCGSKCSADIGMMKNVKKVAVEDLQEEAAKGHYENMHHGPHGMHHDHFDHDHMRFHDECRRRDDDRMHERMHARMHDRHIEDIQARHRDMLDRQPDYNMHH